MKVTAIIPARYGSTRFEGKPLADLLGKPMIQHVYERTLEAKSISRVLVATDDPRIYEAVARFDGEAVMTSRDHETGTDRLAEVASGLDSDYIVNVQGDEPLINPDMIDEAVGAVVNEPGLPMSSLKIRIKSDADFLDPAVVKVVVDRNDYALYFSRAPIPYFRDGGGSVTDCYRHVGLYVYERNFLLEFARMESTPLERAEKLEQLRALENGYRIKVATTEYESIGVDRPEDLEKVRQILKGKV